MKRIVLNTILLSGLSLLATGNVLANLLLAEGGATGSWFNPDRNGEGIFLEIVESGDNGRAISVAWYT